MLLFVCILFFSLTPVLDKSKGKSLDDRALIAVSNSRTGASLNSGLRPVGRHVSLEPAGSPRAAPSSSRTSQDQHPGGSQARCVPCGQGQHGRVAASERRRKCELAGIFYSCEYVHRAALATWPSASAPYRKALTDRPSRDLALLSAPLPLPALPSSSSPTPRRRGRGNELLHGGPLPRLF